MATRILSHAVPSEFIRLDDTISDPDEFLNVRDLQVARENHNILIARGIKRHLFTYVNPITIATPADKTFHSARPASRETGDVLMFMPFRVSSQTKELVVVLQAARSSASADCDVYYAVDGGGSTGVIDTGDAFSITSTAGTGAKVSKTISLPARVANSNHCVLYLYLQGLMFGADQYGGNATILDVGPDWVDVDLTPGGGGTTATVNNAIYVNTVATPKQDPRLITGIETINAGADQYRLHLDAPWSSLPVPGVDTLEEQQTIGVNLMTVSVYENSLSNFHTQAEVF
jgi:hypothetical protein